MANMRADLRIEMTNLRLGGQKSGLEYISEAWNSNQGEMNKRKDGRTSGNSPESYRTLDLWGYCTKRKNLI